MRKGRFLSLILIIFLMVITTASVQAVYAKEENATKIIGYAGESSFSFFIAENKSIYSLGDNSCGQLGIGINDFRSKYAPQPIGNLPAIADIKTGSKHAVALAENGKVFTWGNNSYGQLGLYGRNSQIKNNLDIRENLSKYIEGRDAGIPNEIIFDDNVIIEQVTCGGNYTLFLDSNGNVWATGQNQFGELGIGGETGGKAFVSEPRRVSSASGVGYLNNIVKIETALTASFALDNEGKVYAWGSDFYGLMGDGIGRVDSKIPVLIAGSNGGELPKIKDINAAEKNLIMIGENDEIFLLGDNSFGQTANGTYSRVNSEWIHSVHKIDYFFKNNIEIEQFVNGGFAMFVKAVNGDIYSWGMLQNGSLGIGKYEDLPNSVKGEGTVNEVLIPYKVPFDGVFSSILGTAGSRTFALDMEGRLWAWGENSFGQLGNNDPAFKNAELPVLSTLDRVADFDKLVPQKNYLIFPIIFICAVVVLFAVWIFFISRSNKKLLKMEAEYSDDAKVRYDKLFSERVKKLSRKIKGAFCKGKV